MLSYGRLTIHFRTDVFTHTVNILDQDFMACMVVIKFINSASKVQVVEVQKFRFAS